MNASSPARSGAWESKVWLGVQLVGEDVRDEILLGREVAVEGAVGQAGLGHDGRHAGAVDAVLLEASPGRFDYSLPRRLLVVLAVAHSAPLWEPPSIVAVSVCLRSQYYDRTIILCS